MSTNGIGSFFVKRRWVFVVLSLITPAGFLCKWYAGPAQSWFNNYGAAVFYEIFWCMVVFLFFARKEAAAKIAIGVFVITALLEILQLWQPPLLQQIRSTFPGKTLLGTTFVWWDFPYYVLGCLIGWLAMRVLSKGFKPS